MRIYLPEHSVTLKQQLSVKWWWEVGDNPMPPVGYAGGLKQWQRRNWLHNFRRYVIGVSHLKRWCFGSMTETGNAFVKKGGWLWGISVGRWFVLPYLSLRLRNDKDGEVWDFALGWSSFGMLMVKCRKMRRGAYDWE